MKITLPDKTVKEFPDRVTVAEIAAAIGPGLKKAALAGVVNGRLVDLDYRVAGDSTLRVITFADDEGKEIFWHSSAHVMAQAVLDLYWAVIDSAHAALMEVGEIPPSPNHVADLMQQKLVDKKLMPKRYVDIMKLFYETSKKIARREIKDIKGMEYEIYYKKAKDFV